MPAAEHTGQRKHRGKQAGFTLIELLVVVSIIMLLVAILLPVLGNARSSARQIQCLANLRQLAVPMNLYADDYQGWFPHYYTGVTLPDGRTWSLEWRDKIWMRTLADLGYAGTTWIQARDGDSAYKTIFWCPEDQRDMTPGVPNTRNNPSYAINLLIAQHAPAAYRWRQRDEIRSPAQTMHLVDGARTLVPGESLPDYSRSNYIMHPYVQDGFPFGRSLPDFRHLQRGAIASLYTDGHAESRGEALTTQPNDVFWGLAQ